MCAWNSKIVKWRKCKHTYHHRTCSAHMHYVCVNKHTENMCMKNKSCISCISSIYKVFMSTNTPWWSPKRGKNTMLWMVNWCDDGTCTLHSTGSNQIAFIVNRVFSNTIEFNYRKPYDVKNTNDRWYSIQVPFHLLRTIHRSINRLTNFFDKQTLFYPRELFSSKIPFSTLTYKSAKKNRRESYVHRICIFLNWSRLKCKKNHKVLIEVEPV